MAETLVIIEGFDEYDDGTDVTDGGWSAGGSSIESGNIAGYNLRLYSTSTARLFPAASDYVHVLLSFKVADNTGSGTFLELREGSTIHTRIAYNGNGTFTVSRAGTTVGTTPTSANMGIASNTWYHLELCARVHDTAGFYRLYVNGVQACDGGGTALDTRNAGTAGTPDRLYLTFGTSTSLHIDDIVVYTGSGTSDPQPQKGMSRVITKFPNADGANTAWTASSGSDYACVDERGPNDDTDYISTSNVNDIDTFTHDGIGVTTGTVLGVAPSLAVRKDDAGTRSVRAVIRRGSTDYAGSADFALTTSYVYLKDQIWETDPSTSSAWTISNVDAAEFGVKCTA